MGNSQNLSNTICVVSHKQVGQDPVNFKFDTVELVVAIVCKSKKFNAGFNYLSLLDYLFHSQFITAHKFPDFANDGQNLKLTEILALV